MLFCFLDSSFVKFQILQYASIYEAVISYMLWNKLEGHEEVIKLGTHKSYKPVSAFGSLVNIKYGEEKLFTCVYRDGKTPRNSIPFHDKVDCSVRIGFVEKRFAEDIKNVYKIRNLAHLEAEASKKIEVEIEHAKLGYLRIQPFLEKINEYIHEEM